MLNTLKITWCDYILHVASKNVDWHTKSVPGVLQLLFVCAPLLMKLSSEATGGHVHGRDKLQDKRGIMSQHLEEMRLLLSLFQDVRENAKA